MSRSRRKRPFCGLTTSESEKQDKVLYHKRLRRKTRQRIRYADEDTALPNVRDESNPYMWDKDGKQRFDPNRNPECMRK